MLNSVKCQNYVSTRRHSETRLIIFDNADDPLLLKTFLPETGVHVLATSRSPQWPQGVGIDKMTLAEVEMFIR